MALARLRAISYSYPSGDEPALAGVSAEIEPGLLSVTGPSGAGKSTFLRLLNGLVPHFHGGRLAGSAWVDGLDVATTPVRRLATRTGFVFQDPETQLLQSKVEAEVAFGPCNLGLPRLEVALRVDEALERAGAAHLRERSVATLSGGERQRVAIASALAMRPAILALDEPASQLDAAGGAAVARACRDLAAQGMAVVVAERRLDLSEARRLALAPEADAAPPTLPPPPSGEAPAWELSSVSVGFDRRPILEGVELAGLEGAAVALVGPNGGGKTTLLRVIAGLLQPLSGRVLRAPGRVAYLPQNPVALLHRPTVRSEVAWTLDRSGSAEAPERILAELNLGDLAGRYPRDLSGGERQRAAVAAVLAGAPRTVLLDEPTRGFDGATRAALVNTLARLRAGGCSLVVATHDADLVHALGATEFLVAGGRVSRCG